MSFSNESLRQLTAALTADADGASLTKNTVTALSAGANTIHTPAAGKAIRLYFFGYSAGSDVTGVLAQLRFANHAPFDSEYMVAAGQPYARNIQAGKRFVDGGVDEPLVLTLDAAQTVYVNYEIEEV